MCFGDTSVGYFIRSDEGLEPQADVKRVCRKFDKLQEWAKDHQAIVAVI
jgi:hypothetical protein